MVEQVWAGHLIYDLRLGPHSAPEEEGRLELAHGPGGLRRLHTKYEDGQRVDVLSVEEVRHAARLDAPRSPAAQPKSILAPQCPRQSTASIQSIHVSVRKAPRDFTAFPTQGESRWSTRCPTGRRSYFQSMGDGAVQVVGVTDGQTVSKEVSAR
ncbi:hypothetical protein FA95DRAFT_1220938 [Auriscalpium vulgare]|uniref:Uncharacterized protein n=1 Tax=Auriscalpium vulgare TaxID=40419 RepID=A0ACB8R338_9AGAM|nr:hypothetical protein FA95DRAFT_1220938 [Auriscalpium vulgare]